jgi:hypothetical protein
MITVIHNLVMNEASQSVTDQDFSPRKAKVYGGEANDRIDKMSAGGNPSR